MKLLKHYLAKREQLAAAVRTLQDAAAADERDLTDTEQATADDTLRQITDLDVKIDALRAAEETLAKHADTMKSLKEQAEPAADSRDQEPKPLTIKPREQKPYTGVGEYMVDLVRTMRFPGGQAGMPSFDRAAAERVGAALGRAVGDVAAGDHVTTADTTGLLPVTIVGQIVQDLDAARPLINAIGAKDLGGIPGATFNRPTITKHHDQGTGKQPEEKAEGQGGEVKIGSLPFTKESFLRWMNVSMQVIDWTSPGAWEVLIGEFLAEYALDTEIAAETKLLAGITQTEAAATDDYPGWVQAFYAAQTKIVTAGGNRRRGALRTPDLIVTSLDMAASIGALIDIAVATAQKVDGTPLSRFGGLLVNTQRVMAPSLPDGTVLFGRKNAFEFYEQRKGFLQAIEPKVMGVEISYGGYAAAGFVDASLWSKVTAPAAP